MPRRATSGADHIPERDRPRYAISVVAEMLQVHPQTLRLYERQGLLTPGRTPKRTRLYSEADVERLQEIVTYTRDMGINLAGVEVILHLKEQIAQDRAEFQRIMQAIAERFQVTLEEYGMAEPTQLVPVRVTPPAPKK